MYKQSYPNDIIIIPRAQSNGRNVFSKDDRSTSFYHGQTPFLTVHQIL